MDSVGSGGISEKTEFQDKAKPFLAKYEAEIQQASRIEDPEDRKKALESAYNSLSDELEGIKGTQEGRDAQSDRHREREEKKTVEEKNRERTLKHSDGMLKAAKEIEVDIRVRELSERASHRQRMVEANLKQMQKERTEATKTLSGLG